MRTRHTKEAVLNLEQQKKQARELLRAIRSGNADAISRLRSHHAAGQRQTTAPCANSSLCTTRSLSSLVNKGSQVGPN